MRRVRRGVAEPSKREGRRAATHRERRGWQAAIFVLVVPLVLVAGACGSSQPAATSSSVGSTVPSPPATNPLTPTLSSTGESCQSLAGLAGPVNDHGTKTLSGSTVQLVADSSFPTAHEAWFAPTCVVVSSRELTVVVTNESESLHNFSVTSLKIEKDIPPGHSIKVGLHIPASEPLVFFCKYHSPLGQQGAILTEAA